LLADKANEARRTPCLVGKKTARPLRGAPFFRC
jgi:hypothetical protein